MNFSVDDQQELCYNQALNLLKKLPPSNLVVLRQLGFFLNLLSEERFFNLVKETTPKKESYKDDLFS